MYEIPLILGPRERHLHRRLASCLFADEPTEADLVAARSADGEERDAFLDDTRDLVQRAVDLKPNEETDVVLALRGELDRAYVIGCSLGLREDRLLFGLQRLIEVIGDVLRRTAGDDPLAQRELDDEARARQSHYTLLKHELVADLMRPDSPVEADDLVPTLLSASEEALAAALWLFDPEHIQSLVSDGETLLEERRGAGCNTAPHEGRLAQLRAASPSGDTFVIHEENVRD